MLWYPIYVNNRTCQQEVVSEGPHLCSLFWLALFTGVQEESLLNALMEAKLTSALVDMCSTMAAKLKSGDRAWPGFHVNISIVIKYREKT